VYLGWRFWNKLKEEKRQVKIIEYKLNVYTENIRRLLHFDFLGLYAGWRVSGFLNFLI
jgi:hypothetical protein